MKFADMELIFLDCNIFHNPHERHSTAPMKDKKLAIQRKKNSQGFSMHQTVEYILLFLLLFCHFAS